MSVKWRIDGIFKADAEKVYSEIGDTSITPEEVLRRAKDPNTELHKCFEWDDSIAAEKYRIEQARMVLRQIVYVEVKKDAAPVRVFQISREQRVYTPTKLIVKQPDEYQALLKRALMELEAFKRKYKTLGELEEIFGDIDELLAR